MSDANADLAGRSPGAWLRRRPRLALALAAAAVMVVAAAFLFRGGGRVQYFTAPVRRADIRDVVDVTGTINPVRTVQVGSQVSGTIAELRADFNSPVHTGQVVAVIDPSLFQGALLQANADLANARAGVVAAQASVDKAHAMLAQAKADYERTSALGQSGVVTQTEQDAATAAYQSAKAAVAAAVASVAQANAAVSQKEAAVEIARANLAHTIIRSPIDGVVVARNVDVGQTVAASLQAPTIFTIAQDLSHMQLYAKMDESEVGEVRVGRHVTFQVDAFPTDTFTGVLQQMRMNATTVQNVVTYDAIIDFDNPDRKLLPGMTAYVTIPVATARNAVAVPNSALRYHPPLSPAEIRRLYARYGIEDSTLAADTATGGDSAAAAHIDRARRAAHETAVVWKLQRNGAIVPVRLALGITDHASTQVLAVLGGSLAPGDSVITASLSTATPPPGAQPARR